ncbi:MAG: ferredoxin [Clostridia bacterium]|nr:ferredoxin [Clostridia bacterium]
MKAMIDRGNCISCGLCASICPQVFRMADDGLAEVCADPIPESAKDAAAEARDNCPVSVITIEGS